jgi:endonuclease/exonuclease/phosphatase family metal-dependent hydrolase
VPIGKLRVLTLNCLFLHSPRARLRVVGRLLKDMAPDVICLQEIFFRRNVRLLDDNRALFRPWGVGVRGGLVTVANGPVDQWSFERFRTGLWFEWIARKGFLTTRLRLGGEPVTVVNTHLLANYDENWALDNRYARRQLDELDQLAEAIRRLPADELLVVAGDFNVPAMSAQFREFMAACGLRNAVDWSAFPAGNRGSPGIDNILYRAPLGRQITATATLCLEEKVRLDDGRSAYPSDHVGVEAELEW